MKQNMHPFIETIRLRDGSPGNLPYHQERFERTRREALQCTNHPLLADHIHIPGEAVTGLFKCRVRYGKDIGPIEITPYVRKNVRSLKLVCSDAVSYRYKYLDRSELDRLFRMKGNCDDILIVKEGMITDSYYANVALWDGQAWVTPDTPLLPGTMRSCLIDREELLEIPVTPDDLPRFSRIRLINAMNSLDEAADIPVEAVMW